MMRIATLLVLILLGGNLFAANKPVKKHHAQFPLDCSECHSCEQPRYERPCLKLFPDFKRSGYTMSSKAKDMIEIIRIDELSNLYAPTDFTHKLHAEMADMSGGCALCHHNNPPGKVLPCVACHSSEPVRSNLNSPGLKGAYHRLCLSCHQEWDRQTNCTVCHLKKDESGTAVKQAQAKRKDVHPTIQRPQKKLYDVDFEEGPIVTFFHDTHSSKYGYKCVDCHENQSCVRCHATDRVQEDREPHINCVACHESETEDNCTKCHSIKERPRFTHSQTGWPLNRFHRALQCTECHGMQFKTKTPKKACVSCHSDFEPGRFNHSVTGLALSEDHLDLDCSDCHRGDAFKLYDCSDCHDAYTYPKQKPGKRVRR